MQVGVFRDDFFIDHIDHEYGLRLNLAGYQIIELPMVRLKHNLGERKRLGLYELSYVSHSPIRGYYIVRNGIVLIRLYGLQFPKFSRRLYKLIFNELIKAIFFESQKCYRLNLLHKGIVDARTGQLGKLVE